MVISGKVAVIYISQRERDVRDFFVWTKFFVIVAVVYLFGQCFDFCLWSDKIMK